MLQIYKKESNSIIQIKSAVTGDNYAFYFILKFYIQEQRIERPSFKIVFGVISFN